MQCCFHGTGQHSEILREAASGDSRAAIAIALLQLPAICSDLASWCQLGGMSGLSVFG